MGIDFLKGSTRAFEYFIAKARHRITALKFMLMNWAKKKWRRRFKNLYPKRNIEKVDL